MTTKLPIPVDLDTFILITEATLKYWDKWIDENRDQDFEEYIDQIQMITRAIELFEVSDEG